ncbi:hypothetical protein TKK_0007320 [Trichogramma kaykai]
MVNSQQVLLALVLLAVAASSTPTPASNMPRPSYARTMLKVSRSLPGETEEVKVRTSEGNLATLIVKRREKTIAGNELSARSIRETTTSTERPASEASSPKVEASSTTTTTTTTSSPWFVAETSTPAPTSATPTTRADATTASTIRAAPTSTTIGYHSVDVDPWSSQIKTWTRASSEKSAPVEEPRNWVPVNRGWQPVEQQQQQPSGEDEARKSFATWLVADDTGSARSFQLVPSDDGSTEKVVRYAFLPYEPKTRTNVGANLLKNRDAKNVPPEVVVRSEINIKPQPGQPGQQQPQQPQAEAKRLPPILNADGSITIHGRRVPDDPIDKIQVWRNARVINNQLVTDPNVPSPTVPTTSNTGAEFERFFENVNRRYIKTPQDDKNKAYRNEVLAAEIYDTAENTYRPSIRKRMLQPEIPGAVYPNSRLYLPQDKGMSQTIKHGTRAPVLQYAHPELGVQPAKALKNEQQQQQRQADEAMESPRQQYHQYQREQQQQQQKQYQQQPQQHQYGEYRQKKKYVINEKNLVDPHQYKPYYPQQFYGIRRPEPPFWIKMTENIKSGFHDGVAKVSEFTKPVFDPLVEATRKISENLGLSRSQDHAQDKIGTVASSGSVLIPALGLVASGAALGIGAVAVGRYLDVDVLKRSNDGTLELNEDNLRALGYVSELPENNNNNNIGDAEKQSIGQGVYVLMPDSAEGSVAVARKRRSVQNDLTSERHIPRKGLDSIEEIVEIDVPSKSIIGATIDQSNDIKEELTTNQAFESPASSQKVVQLSADNQGNAERLRKRRSIDDGESNDELQHLSDDQAPLSTEQNTGDDWSNTACAKRNFCKAMLERGYDSHAFMDKKMNEMLRM